MTKQNINSKKGFTIIEVVLVLAIAGLIFLMVFIAYPALRRSQSDTQRREDMSKALAQLTSYIANNRKPPQTKTAYDTFFSNYLTDTAEGFADPDGNNYIAGFLGKCNNADNCATSTFASNSAGNGLNTTASAVTIPTDLNYTVYYWFKARCKEGQDMPVMANGDKEVAIIYKLEGGGYYCGSNSN